MNENVEEFSAAASLKVQQVIQSQISRQNVRTITIGEQGMKKKMLLVRPNVVVGPGWEKICRQRREEWQDERAGNVLNMIKSAVTDLDKGKERDTDIVNMSENEINLNDKIILLVSRILNDKKSLPGYVYRGMIQEFRD